MNERFEHTAAWLEYCDGMTRFQAETEAARRQGKQRWECVGDAARRVVESSEAEIAKRLVRYEAESGKLFWNRRGPADFQDGEWSAQIKCNRWNARYADREAFTARNAYGYAVGKIFGQTQFAHRVAWLIQTGSWPDKQVDHINGVRDDNSWQNLRLVTVSENQRNRHLNENSKTGVPGVFWSGRDKVYRAQITVNGKRISLGSFKQIEDAKGAREKAEKEHGFTGRNTKKARDQRAAMAARGGADDMSRVQPHQTQEG